MGWLLRQFFKLWVRAAVQPAEAPEALTAPRVPVCYVLETRFAGGPRRAVQCHSQGRVAVSRKAFQQSASGRASLVLRRGPPPPLLGCHDRASSAAAPAGAGRSLARRFGARRHAGADRGVLGSRAAERGLVAAPAVRRELGADFAREQVLRRTGQRPQRHGRDGRAQVACARCSTPRRRTTRRGALRAFCAAACAVSAPSASARIFRIDAPSWPASCARVRCAPWSRRRRARSTATSGPDCCRRASTPSRSPLTTRTRSCRSPKSCSGACGTASTTA